MPKNEDEFENYLGEFQPQEVRPLEVSRPVKSTRARRLAAAAVVVISLGTGLWYAGQEKKPGPIEDRVRDERSAVKAEEWKPNSIFLTKLALDDPKRFEEQMDQASRLMLPDLRGEQSTLRVLAK